MKKVLVFSLLLLGGLFASQVLPSMISGYENLADVIRVLTMAALAYIMIRVGYEFDIDKSNLKQYGWDYVVAFTAATFPWIFVTLYFIFVLLPPEFWADLQAWKETLLAGRFAAPTSAGVLFSMLAAAGLGATWLFKKARILAIFDDLDTVLLMIPLKMLMVGLAWQLGIIVMLMIALLALAYLALHKVRVPTAWGWVLGYSFAIALVSEVIYKGSKIIDESVPIHIEVLLPAFVLGCMMAYPKARKEAEASGDRQAIEKAHHADPMESPSATKASTLIAGAFMVLVGLSMPAITGGQADPTTLTAAGAPAAEATAAQTGKDQGMGTVTAAQPTMGWGLIALHVLIITVICNIGKMFPAFCYRKEAHWRERLGVAIGMWPRGEVGAGVLVISLSYGIGGPIVTIAMLSLALNLVCTGVFIVMVQWLIKPIYDQQSASAEPDARGRVACTA